MMINFDMDNSFVAKARGVDYEVDVTTLPEASLRKVFEYGLQRILNDACAGAKDDDEAIALANKRWTNLVNGVLRASPNREGDPVKAEAKRLALAKVLAAPGYTKWLAANGLKKADKVAKAKAAELAAEYAKGEAIMAQAKANVEAAKEIELDIEI